jgi:hypothetical protein
MESDDKPSVWWIALHRSRSYMVGSRSSPVLVFALYAACIFGLPELAQAQNETNAVTDPAEGISLSLLLFTYPERKKKRRKKTLIDLQMPQNKI